MDVTPFDRQLLRAALAGASPDQIAERFGLPKNQAVARMRRLLSVLGQAAGSARKPNAARDHLSGLHDAWGLRAGSKALPAHRDFRLTDLRPWLHDIAIVEVSQSPLRLTPRLMGRNLITCAGIDLSRRELQGVLPAHVRETMLEPFARCVAEGAPQYQVITFPPPHLRRYPIHLLLLPCASDGRTVDILIAAALVEDGDECVRRALGAYSRRLRTMAFDEFIEAGIGAAATYAQRAARNLALIATSGTAASGAARSTLDRFKLSA